MTKLLKLKPLILTALVAFCFTVGLQEKSQAVQLKLDSNDITKETKTSTKANGKDCKTVENDPPTLCTFKQNSDTDVENLDSGNTNSKGKNLNGNSFDYLGVFDKEVLAIVNKETNSLIAILNYETKDPNLNVDVDFSNFDSGMKKFEVWELVLDTSTPPIIMGGVFMGNLPAEDLNMLAAQLGVYNIPLNTFGDIDFTKKGLNFGVASFGAPVFALNHTEIPEPTSVVSIVGIGVLGAFASRHKEKK